MLPVMRIARAGGAFALPLCAALAAVAPSSAAGHPAELRFTHLGQSQGLSTDAVRAIAEGPRGFMWLGTPDGLNRYDGYSFEVYGDGKAGLSANGIEALVVDRAGTLWVGTLGGGVARYDRDADRFVEYRHDPADPASLSSDYVLALHADSDGALWAGGYEGLDRYDPATGGFVHYGVDEESPSRGLSAASVRAILEGRDGDLWIGTIGGLTRFDRDRDRFEHFVHDPEDAASLGDDDVWALAEDRAGRLWVGTDGGLSRLDRERRAFTRFSHDDSDPRSLASDHVAALLVDARGDVWVGTDGGGLSVVDPVGGGFVHCRHDPGDETSIASNVIRTIFEDGRGDLWVGTFGGGVSHHNRATTAFTHTRHRPGSRGGLSRDSVLSLLAEPDGTLWVGTDGGGLNRLDPGSGRTRVFRHDPKDERSLSGNSPLAVYRDRGGRLWVGTNHGGLSRMDPDGRGFVRYRHDPSDPHTLSNPHVWDIREDGEGRLWVATFEGVDLYRPASDDFVRYVHDPGDPTSVGHSLVWSLYRSRDGLLWAATQRGLSAYVPDRDAFETWLPRTGGLGGEQVYAVTEDRDGRMWVGTGGGGLLRFDRATGAFEVFGAAQGLANEVVSCLGAAADGSLWLGTDAGLSRFDPKSRRFTNYDRRDGVLTGPLAKGACARTRDGRMLFGGRRGIVSFDPADVLDDAHVPPVVLTDFRIFNRPVPVGGPVLRRPITEAREIRLRHDQSVITFGFASLSYRAPEKNRYAYVLEPFDRDWAEVGSRRTATYTNLDPGTYTFRVRGTNEAGRWSEREASIAVVVLPPYWATWWFRSASAVTLVLVAVAAYRRRTRSILAHNAALLEEVGARRRAESELERLVEKLEAQNAELERFNYSVSHDLKSPLVTMKGFLGLLRQNLAAGNPRAVDANLARIEKAADHMRVLLDELLELGRLGRLPNRPETVPLSEVVREAADLLSGRLAVSSVELEIQPDMPTVQADRARLLEAFQNLLDNAVKFLGDQPRPLVRVGASREGAEVRCWVSDNGVGIDARYRERIFEVFERLSADTEGAGVGLAIVKRVVEAHGGRVWVESDGPGSGSTFRFTLPGQGSEPTTSRS